MIDLSTNQIKVIAEGLGYAAHHVTEHGGIYVQSGSLAWLFDPEAPEHVLAMLKQLILEHGSLTVQEVTLNDGIGFMVFGTPIQSSPEEAIVQAYLVMVEEK